MSQQAAKVGRSVREFAAAVSIGCTKAYELMATGEIQFAKIGRRTVILDDPREFLQRYARKAA